MLHRFSLPPEITQFWTTDEIYLATSRLEGRIHDVEALQVHGVRHRDPNLRNVERRIRDTILEIFGIVSQQFYRHERFKIDDGPSFMGTHFDDLGALDALRQAQFVERIPGAIARIRGLIDSLEEQREELEEARVAPEGRSRGTASIRRLRAPRVTSVEAAATRRQLSRRKRPWLRS